jgi:hypothetical protein
MLTFSITANGNTTPVTLKPRVPEVARLVNLRTAGTFGNAKVTVYSSINGGTASPAVGGENVAVPRTIGITLTAGSNVFINTVNATPNTTNIVVTIEG